MRTDRGERIVAIGEHRIVLAFDPDAELWYVRSGTVPGLDAQAADADELIAELPALIRYLSIP